jgi:hypothetical protein
MTWDDDAWDDDDDVFCTDLTTHVPIYYPFSPSQCLVPRRVLTAIRTTVVYIAKLLNVSEPRVGIFNNWCMVLCTWVRA